MTDVQQLKSMHPLSSIVGQVVKLRRAGRELVGLCPFHAEKTPSLYVNDEKGAYYCHGCAASGDVVQFVMASEGVGFLDALEMISSGSSFGFHSPALPSKPSKASDNAMWAKDIWRSAQPIAGTIAEKYLARRGIDLRLLHRQLPLRFAWLKCKGLPGEHPTLVAGFTDLSGDVTSIQRIFLTRDGQKINVEFPSVDAKQCLGSSIGDAVKFGDDTDNIILAESVEDGLSLAQALPDQTVWAVAGATKIPKVILPPGCATVIIAPDNDPAGRKAIEEGRAKFHAQGKAVAEMVPSEPFRDWNEQHLAEKRA